jgi:hypothetical protein
VAYGLAVVERRSKRVTLKSPKWFCLLMIALAWFATSDVAMAQGTESTENAEQAKSETDKKKNAEVADEDRERVIAFAKEHHPELAGLLEQLKKSRPNEFNKAVRELRQQISALDRVRERSPAKYAEQLASWKRDSQIRLLMARWAKKNDPAIEKEIRALLKERREARLAQLKADRERVNQQQRKLDEQLLEFEKPIDDLVGEEWDQLAKRNRKAKYDK